ncbi:MAG: DNA adenine methylase [Gammaproteobacteria bacterium]
MQSLKAPFPYFGGKSSIASVIWQALGDVPNYVEPFCGSLAVLLARPHAPTIETVNDKDGFVSNFWRALHADPDAVAHHADWPACENDLHARHAWLVGQKHSMQQRLGGDPWWYDALIAGWWVWGQSLWIGQGFCSGHGPWQVQDGELICAGQGEGIHRSRLHLTHAGQGIRRKLLHLSDAGQGELDRPLHRYCQALAERLRLGQFRCASGEWSRVCGPSVTIHNGVTGVLLDPPYGHETGRDTGLYRQDKDVTAQVDAWCQEWGTHRRMRIVLCGYTGEYPTLVDRGWTVYHWKARGGYGAQSNGAGRANAHRERLWFSPHCLPIAQWQQQELFGDARALGEDAL